MWKLGSGFTVILNMVNITRPLFYLINAGIIQPYFPSLL